MKNIVGNGETFPESVRCPENGDLAAGSLWEAGYQDLADQAAYLKARALAYPLVIPIAAFKPAAGTVDTFGVSTGGFYSLQVLENNGEFMLDLGPYLVSGLTLDSIELRVLPGAARSGTSRTRLRLVVSGFADGAGDAATTSDAYDDTTDSEQVITLSPAEVVDKTTKSYGVFIRSGADGSDNADTFYNLRVNCS